MSAENSLNKQAYSKGLPILSKHGSNKELAIVPANVVGSYIKDNDVSSNEIAGDLNIGSTVINLPSFNISVGANALKKLIEEHEKLKEESPVYLYVLEELQSKITDLDSRKVIGLEEKLLKAEKTVFLEEALLSSQKASKMILKFQHIKSYQIIFIHILSLIITRFRSHILPLIKSGANDLAIRAGINSVIIEPLYQEVSLAGGYVTSELIEGMLFFLTEKCHVEWM